MIGVDTNVVLRLFVDDDEIQHAAARRFFSERTPDDPAYLSIIVIVELYWLLCHTYRLGRSGAHHLIAQVLSSDDFMVEDADFLRELLRSDISVDIADALIARSARQAGCDKTMTFDNRAVQRIPSMELLS